PPAPAAVPAATLVVDKPLRSGQQVYAKGGDLVLLAGVSPGAEVIADGSIHCYGPLRGRALAGARGDHTARIFSTNFGPELVSIAGVYRTFERGIPQAVAGRGTQVRLTGSDALHTLEITPLATD
ncbi:MAG TPA: septum site-determining protein MinC, partial [Rhodocyclaceae bacterium]|nr:septum site-determining protein MinC [Rhodocyclaceae bacterium]